MIISSKQIQSISKLYSDNKISKTTQTASANKPGHAQRRDEVVLSSQVKEFAPILQALKDMPDVRADKVKEISAKIQSGTYTVSGAEVADKMIGRIMADRLV